MKNIQHSTFNSQPPTGPGLRHPWMFSVECWLLNVPKSLLIFAVRVYRLTVSPAQAFLFGGNSGCRFTPTCSQFAIEALRERGAVTGTILSAKRICRCHPWGGHGHDPVPKKEFGIHNSGFNFHG
jgi:putative membrane protein insertion efficiency factor